MSKKNQGKQHEPLLLSFDPDAIRDHFVDCQRVQKMSDEGLLLIGEAALEDDRLYEAFNRVLRNAFENLHDFDPDAVSERECYE